MEVTKRQKELLEKGAVAVATINQDGSPDVITIGFPKVVDPGKGIRKLELDKASLLRFLLSIPGLTYNPQGP